MPRTSKTDKLSPEQIRLAIQLHQEGKNTSEISKEVGIDWQIPNSFFYLRRPGDEEMAPHWSDEEKVAFKKYIYDFKDFSKEGKDGCSIFYMVADKLKTKSALQCKNYYMRLVKTENLPKFTRSFKRNEPAKKIEILKAENQIPIAPPLNKMSPSLSDSRNVSPLNVTELNPLELVQRNGGSMLINEGPECLRYTGDGNRPVGIQNPDYRTTAPNPCPFPKNVTPLSEPDPLGGAWGEFEKGYVLNKGTIVSAKGGRVAIVSEKLDEYQEQNNYFIPRGFKIIWWP